MVNVNINHQVLITDMSLTHSHELLRFPSSHLLEDALEDFARYDVLSSRAPLRRLERFEESDGRIVWFAKSESSANSFVDRARKRLTTDGFLVPVERLEGGRAALERLEVCRVELQRRTAVLDDFVVLGRSERVVCW